MLPLIIFGVTVGAILGTRFRVLVLVPVNLFAAVTIIAAGFVNGFGVGVSLVVLLVFLASVEFGYLAGCFGAGYFFRRINLRRIAGLPADGIALAILATAVILFAVFYELSSSRNTKQMVAAPDVVSPAVDRFFSKPPRAIASECWPQNSASVALESFLTESGNACNVNARS